MQITKNLNSRLENNLYDVLTGYRKIEFHRSGRSFSQQEEEAVERKWNELLSQGKVKFSSELIALYPEKTQLIEGSLHVTGYKTDYKHYRATLDEPVRVWITGPSGIVRIADMRDPVYIFGERKSIVSNTGGAIEFVPGGYLKAAHFDKENPFLETLLDELEEETGIPRNFVQEVNPFWIGRLREYDGKLFQDVCIDFITGLSGISPEEVQKYFDNLLKKEHNRIEFVRESQLINYADKNLERISQRGKCSLQLLLNLV